MKKALFAKQPILDNAHNLYGYEILYRDSDVNQAQILNGESATAKLLVNYCSGVFESLNEAYVKIFINITKPLIMAEHFLPLPPDRVVFEILEEIDVDDELLVRISELKQQGYTFAIDDYQIDRHLEDLLPLMNIIKVDVLDCTPTEPAKIIKKIKRVVGTKYKPILLAEKIEDEVLFQACQEAGFELFQGYFLAKPKIVYGQNIESSQQSVLNLIASLQNDDIRIEDVVKLVEKEVQLAFQLLKIVNSPLCRIPRKVDSIQDAVVYLGLKTVKKWSLIMVLSSQSEGNIEVLRLLLERAKFCEILASLQNQIASEQAFTVGLFSSIDLLLKADKRWVIKQLNLTTEISQAIVSGEGPLGQLLEMALMIEQAKFEEMKAIKSPESDALVLANLEATRWANETIAQM